jgi:hypothetical protein
MPGDISRIFWLILVFWKGVSRDSSVGIATGWTAGVRFPAEARGFLYSTPSRPALEPTQSPIQWVSKVLSPALKRQGSEAEHSHPSSDNSKNGGAIPSLPHTSLWRGA